MAIYRGREVTIVNFVQPDLTVHDTIQVVDKDGQSFSPKVSEVQFTEDEKKSLKNYHTNRFDQVNVIKDADLKKVRDDSDPKVIEKRQAEAAGKVQKPTPVVIVDPQKVPVPVPQLNTNQPIGNKVTDKPYTPVNTNPTGKKVS